MDLIERQAAIDAINKLEYPSSLVDVKRIIVDLPSEQQDIAEKLYPYKCYITDQEGLRHEVIHTDDIRRVTGWLI